MKLSWRTARTENEKAQGAGAKALEEGAFLGVGARRFWDEIWSREGERERERETAQDVAI